MSEQAVRNLHTPDEATDRHLERCNQLEASASAGEHHSLALQIANNRLLKELRSRG